MFTIIKNLISALLTLVTELETLQAINEALNNKLNRQQAIIAELEGQVQGWKVKNSFIQSIEICPGILEARETLRFYKDQDGFFGGRILESTPTQVRLQSFWIDNNPPSSWVVAWIRSEQLPDGMRHTCLPPFLQKTIRLYTERDIL